MISRSAAAGAVNMATGCTVLAVTILRTVRTKLALWAFWKRIRQKSFTDSSASLVWQNICTCKKMIPSNYRLLYLTSLRVYLSSSYTTTLSIFLTGRAGLHAPSDRSRPPVQTAAGSLQDVSNLALPSSSLALCLLWGERLLLVLCTSSRRERLLPGEISDHHIIWEAKTSATLLTYEF